MILTCSYNTHAQQVDTTTVKKDKYGLRIGLDLHKLSQTFYDNNFRGFEISGDYRLTKSHYFAGEIGNTSKTTLGDKIDFTTKGSYVKIGFDYNAYDNWLDMQNMIYVGLRYGVSTFSQTLHQYQIYNTNNYFGETIVRSGETYNGLNSQWIEFVTGVKTEIVSNLFLGFNVRINRLISNKKPDNFDNLYIPGFNKTYDGNFGVGFNYSISYLIPLYKK